MARGASRVAWESLRDFGPSNGPSHVAQNGSFLLKTVTRAVRPIRFEQPHSIFCPGVTLAPLRTEHL
jgi:hypothetical protein